MIIKGWHNGSQNNETGAGYGVCIKCKDRDKYFKKEWSSVTIELEGEGEVEVNLSDKFWNNCPELRKKEIGKWIINKINNVFAKWPKGSPPAFELHPICNRKFRLLSIQTDHIDQ